MKVFFISIPIASSPVSTPTFCNPSIGFRSSFLASLCKNKSVNEPSRRLDKIVNPPDYIILDSCFFQTFILADEQFVKPLWIFETCVLVNNNLWKKIVSSIIAL